MLGRTANGLYWMFRYLERAENLARLLDAGFRISLTRDEGTGAEWESILSSAGLLTQYSAEYDEVTAEKVIDFVLRDKDNPQSVIKVLETARLNARAVRTALSREVWEAVNNSWLNLGEAIARPVRERDLPTVLSMIRRDAAQVRGATTGTMLRTDIYNFSRLGTFIERADSTARILDVKYFVLLPSVSDVGSQLDNVQWEIILRAVSALRSYRWLNHGEINAASIAEFLILDRRSPRSLAFCGRKLKGNLNHLTPPDGRALPCVDMADRLTNKLNTTSIAEIFEDGLHEFLEQFIGEVSELARQIEQDYRFYN